MRILALTNLYPNPYQPNRAPWNRHQLGAVAQEHDVRVIAPIAWTDEWEARRKQGRILPHSRKVVLDGIEVEHPRYLFPPKIFREWYGRCFLESVRGPYQLAVKEFRPDLLLASWAYPDGWVAAHLAARDKLPLVIKVHGSDILTLKQYPARRAGTVAALRQADAVIAVSKHLAGELETLGVDPSRVHVVYNGIDTQRFVPRDKADAKRELGWDATPTILFVGNLAPVKQVDVLLAACKQLVDSGVSFRCRIVGDGPLRTSLEATAKRDALTNHVAFHGVVDHAELPAWFQAANVVCLPSRSEGVPNVLLEAMACGTPFVASNVGGIPEIASDTIDHLVPAGDSSALAASIRECLRSSHDSSQRNRTSRTWRESASDIVNVFTALRSESARAAALAGVET